MDLDRRGPAWTRNQGVAATSAPFLVFLDADDTLAPDFVEECLRVWRTGTYIFTNWLMEDKEIQSTHYCGGGWHVVTTLLARRYFERVGGFNNASKGGEDTELYRGLMARGVCGVHLRKPLVSYNKPLADGRSKTFIGSDEYRKVLSDLFIKYGSYSMCCGGDGVQMMIPGNQHLDGDILVQATWMGNRVEHGRATGRIYPRTGNGKLLWIDPKDLAVMGSLYVAIDQDSNIDDPDLKEAVEAALTSVVVAKPTAKKSSK